MKLLRHNQADFATALANAIWASSLYDPKIEESVRAIIADVYERGDEALVELTERFDHVKLSARQLLVTAPTPKVNAKLQRAIAAAHKNVAAFAKRSLRKDWRMRNAQGAVVGEKFEPFERVGIYIPSGTAPLVSTALMTITLAKVAGCAEIVVCSPPPINPSLLYAVRKAGATEVYQIGGAQAIAAMALGTPTIKRVAEDFWTGQRVCCRRKAITLRSCRD